LVAAFTAFVASVASFIYELRAIRWLKAARINVSRWYLLILISLPFLALGWLIELGVFLLFGYRPLGTLEREVLLEKVKRLLAEHERSEADREAAQSVVQSEIAPPEALSPHRLRSQRLLESVAGINRKQAVCLWIGFWMLVLAGLYPPWTGGRGSLGYQFLFTPEARGRVDVPRLCVEWFLVALFTAAGFFALKASNRFAQEKLAGMDSAPKEAHAKFNAAWSRAFLTLVFGGLVALIGWLVIRGPGDYLHSGRIGLRQNTSSVESSALPIAWTPITVPSVGINALLKTEVLDGQTLYQFRVSPVSGEHLLPFNLTANTLPTARQFTVMLYDENGFEVCREAFETGREMNAEGALAALVSNGVMFNCPPLRYVKAKNWNFAHNWPPLSVVRDEMERQGVPTSNPR
jgi:hypothetical protein